MPPSLLGEGDGGNAAPAAKPRPRNAAANELGERWFGSETLSLKSSSTRRWMESIGTLPMSEPNGSTNFPEADEFDMICPEHFPGDRHRFGSPRRPWRKDDFFLISLC